MLLRRYQATDRAAVLAMAPRLTIGVASWRDPDAVAEAVTGWLRDCLDAAEKHDVSATRTAEDPGTVAGTGTGAEASANAVFVAEDGAGRVIGAVTVSERAHFAGEVDAYIGELVVAEESARRGAGRALVGVAEDWARGRGLSRITLDTGAANIGARQFYAALGYAEEDVRLTRAAVSPEPVGGPDTVC